MPKPRKGPKKEDRIMSKTKAGIGSTFDDFLKKEGLLEEVQAVAIKRVIALNSSSVMVPELSLESNPYV